MRLFLHRFLAVGGLLLLAPLCVAILAGPNYFRANAATITVTNTNDNGPGSLRQAIVDAHDGDTIQFDPALNGQAISLTSGELVIDKSITLNGPGSSMLMVTRSSGTFRIFHVMPGRTVTIAGLTMTNGSGTGGGVFNDHATLTINSCVVANNAALDQGGGIYNDGSGSSASLTILNSTVRNNSVWPPQGGGGLPTGGGIANNATLTIDNSLVTGNVARVYWSSGIHLGNGGGIANSGANGILTVTNSVVSNNIAGMPLTGGQAYEGGISNSSAATIGHSTTNNNRSFGPPLMPTGAGYGGGIDNGNGGTLTITGTTFSGNSATWFGGALNSNGIITNCTFSSNQAWGGSGGAIHGDPVVTNCAISGNQAWVSGGGIYGSPTITNSTISGNNAQFDGGGMYGGGIIRHSTISANAGSPGGGILATGPLEIGNTILKTGAKGANIAINGGTVTSHGYNISNDNGTGVLTGPGDQINTDPILGPLQNNGGPTLTYELLTGSPAINAGDPAFTPPPFYDQRGQGHDRVSNGRLDIGSFEVQSRKPTPTATASITPCPGGGQVLFEHFDGVTAPALPAGWSATNAMGPAPLWVTSTTMPNSAPNDIFIDDPATVSDKRLDTRDIPICDPFFQCPHFVGIVVAFNNSYNLESTFDGGVLELSSSHVNNGAFTDITDPAVGGFFSGGGYNTTISTAFMSPIAGRMAWSGNSGGYIATVAFLGPNVIGDYLKLRFRMASDNSGSAKGWRVDNVAVNIFLEGTPCPTATPTATATATTSPTPNPTATATSTPTPTASLYPETPTPTPTPAPAHSLNLSTRMLVQTGDEVSIGGFIITPSTGSGPGGGKQVLLRGIGPSLGQFGVPDSLADPVMELHAPAGFTTIINDNWRDTQQAAIQATGLAPTNELESAILVTLAPGPYTAIVKGKNNTSGVGLVEIYDLDQVPSSQLANISTRAFVGVGDNVVIGGFILGGGDHAHIFMHAGGPPGINPALTDATLELRDGSGSLLAFNDNCESSIIGPPNPADACIDITLPPALYTTILAGKNGGTGIGLVEIYNLQ